MLIPIYLIRACGRTPSATGWLLAPLGLGMICTYPWMGALTKRFGIRRLSAGGALLALAATLPFLYWASHGLVLTVLACTLLVRKVLIVVGQSDFRTRAFHVEEGVFVMVAIGLATVRNIATVP
jgi:predicted MFS family arabinose efflux permease